MEKIGKNEIILSVFAFLGRESWKWFLPIFFKQKCQKSGLILT